MTFQVHKNLRDGSLGIIQKGSPEDYLSGVLQLETCYKMGDGADYITGALATLLMYRRNTYHALECAISLCGHAVIQIAAKQSDSVSHTQSCFLGLINDNHPYSFPSDYFSTYFFYHKGPF